MACPRPKSPIYQAVVIAGRKLSLRLLRELCRIRAL